MERRTFIKQSCIACTSASLLGGLLGACSPGRFAEGRLNNDGLLINLNEFQSTKEDRYKSYIIVRNEALLFPICIYRFSQTDYAALWMQCAHQGAELNVMGDFLQCPAHGSEYNNRGQVTNGPADSNLRSFPIEIRGKDLFIDLRKK